MSKIMIGLVILSGLGFVLAIIGALFNFNILGVSPEGFSRACSNLALIGIALAYVLIKNACERHN